MSREWSNKTFPTRRNIFLGAAAVATGVITVRLAELQLLRQKEFDELAKDNQIRLDPAPPQRGTIYDRHGRPISTNRRTFYVTLTPEQVGKEDAIAATLDRINEVLPISERNRSRVLREARRNPKHQAIVVADDLTWEDFAKVNARAPELAGVTANVGEQRSYPYYAAFYHTVGFVGRPNEKDIVRMIADEQKANGEDPASEAGLARAANIRRLYLHPQMRVGKQGIEFYAEHQLKGEPGKTALLVNAKGRVIEPVPASDIKGRKGTDLVLALDAELQNYAIQRFGQESGCALVMDIKTGELIVMMSTPGPDPNEFVTRLSDEYWAQLQSDERQPQYHKAYDGVYPPGSTWKMIVAAAALESGKMTPEDRVHCSGKAFYYTRYFNCWRYQGHGWVNVHTALKTSCDCYFYEAARRTGQDDIAKMARRFGYGHRYEIGITGGANKATYVANDEWKRKTYKEQWYAGDTISAAIGQGYVVSTPLQMLVMAARIAGGKNAANPKLVVSGVDVPDQTIEEIGEISDRTMELVRGGMIAVVTEPGGTAYSYLKGGDLDPEGKLPAPYTHAKMAGKSGSAQVRKIEASERDSQGRAIANDKLAWRLRDHAHFVAYAPIDNPRYACAIVVEHGGSGSGVAAPFAFDILKEVLKADPGNKPAFRPQPEVAEAASKEST